MKKVFTSIKVILAKQLFKMGARLLKTDLDLSDIVA